MADEIIKEILSGIMKNEDTDINYDSVLTSDLGISSFDLLQAIYYIETELSISIPSSERKNIVTVGNLCEKVAACRKEI